MSPLSKILSNNSTDCLDCQYRSVRMFCNLQSEALADYNRIGTVVTLPAGATLFREGDAADRVLIICTGLVKVSCNSKGGRVLNLKLAQPGDVLGLSAVISGSRFEVTSDTVEPTVAKVIRRADFLAFLQRHGEASMHAAQSLSEEYKSVFTDARRLALSGSVAGRLANLLLDWGRSTSCSGSKMSFKMVLTHDDLACFTGTTRETVTRTLGKFQKENLIQIRGASVHILSPEKLAMLAA